jgi:hypothetical protein
VTNNGPILLFGMPRSGTTWLGKIFDSHPDTLYRHEPDTWQPMSAIPLLAAPADAARHRAYVEAYLREVGTMRADRVAAKQPLFRKRFQSPGHYQLYRLGVAVSKIAGRLGREMPVAFAPRAAGGARIAWKSIESLGRWGLLMDCLPDAAGVQIIRHPCGYVNSVLRGEAAQRFTHGEAATDVGIFSMLSETLQARRRGLTLQSLMTMHPAERLAWRWILFNEKAAEETSAEPRCMKLYYEELCADPVGVTRRLFSHCGLDWSAQTEEFLDASTSQSRADYYSVFKNPRESAWRWREQLPAEDIERVSSVVANSQLGATYLDGGSDWARG